MADFLHQRRDFKELVAVVSSQRAIDPVLVEKDYWIMHVLWGLQAQGFQFELKGGTSLSKGFGIIQRFSEDIDIRIEPPESQQVKVGRHHDKPAHIESRRHFYDWLCTEIHIPGIVQIERDTAFDDEKMRSAGIRLIYPSHVPSLLGVKTGILLELGFDDTTPNHPVTISSWAYDLSAQSNVKVGDNRAKDVLCYAPGYTFVEKLQTISTKYRRWKETGKFPANFLRHYYDIYCLLESEDVKKFISTLEYENWKCKRFRSGDEKAIAKNSAFLLTTEEHALFALEYQKTAALYYNGQPAFEDMIARIQHHIHQL